MGVFDIISIAFLGYGIYKGFKNGFFVELISFLSVFVGLFAAVKLSSFVGNWISNRFDWNYKLIEISSFVIVFFGAIFLLSLFSHSLTKITNLVKLGWLNSSLGALFSTLKFLIFLSVLFNLFGLMNDKFLWVSKESLEANFCFYPILESSHIIFPEIEKWFYKSVNLL